MHKKSSRFNANRELTGFLFTLPGLLGFMVFTILPFLISLFYSLTNRGGKFVFIKNYIDIFKSKSFLLALKNTFDFIAVGVPLLLIVSMAAALLCFKLIKADVYGAKAIKSMLVLPIVIPTAAVALFVEILFERSGAVTA